MLHTMPANQWLKPDTIAIGAKNNATLIDAELLRIKSTLDRRINNAEKASTRNSNIILQSKKILIKQDNERWTNGNEIDTIIKKNKSPYYIKIKEPTYVHLLYWTSWLDASGFQFRDDMYDLDKKLYDKLRS